jgi:uncharacterized membrane protein
MIEAPMADGNPRSTAQIAGHPIHPMLIPFPVAFLVATLACDVAFWMTANILWAIGSMWLLGAALVMAALAALAGLTDFLGERRIRNIKDAWVHMIGNVIAVVLSLINFYLRYSNGVEAGIFPWGIWISLIVVLLLLFNGWKGWELVYKHRIGIADAPPRDR